LTIKKPKSKVTSDGPRIFQSQEIAHCIRKSLALHLSEMQNLPGTKKASFLLRDKRQNIKGKEIKAHMTQPS
jgi:hypothetical protein